MERFSQIPYPLAVALLASVLLISGCSGSGDPQAPASGNDMASSGNNADAVDDGQAANSVDSSPSGNQTQAPVSTPNSNSPDSDIPDSVAPDSNSPDSEIPDSVTPGSNSPDSGIPDSNTPDPDTPFTDIQDPGSNDTGSGATDPNNPDNPPQSEPDVVVPDTVTSNPTVPGTVVPDPLVQNSTRVDFDIEVPAYQSNALQVQLNWGERVILANWVGDEFWSASDDFPTNSEQPLVVTFSDGNGDITLGSFETLYKTGTNSAESFKISAAQFNTSKWDTDGDGKSNLDELLAGSDPSGSTRVLLFSETKGYRHDSIATALTALEQLATSTDIQTVRADDSAGVFTESNLANFDAVVWVLTSGDVLNSDEQSAFEQYIRAGGGYAGIHAASDTEYDWPWYGALVGAYFERHPAIQTATQTVEDGTHTSTRHLVSTWTRTDEWYDYSANPRSRVNVLLSLDEGTYEGGGMGDDHPSAWYHDYDGGRSWYTGGGHTIDSYAEPDFRAHLLGGLRYAAGHGGQ